MHTLDTVVVILKISERCNINCTYCYFFNGIDQSYKQHPSKISLDLIEDIVIYFKQACQQFKIKTLRFDFHGGEPLLVKEAYLDKICEKLIMGLKSHVNVEFCLQTNAMLINERWISLFNKYKINIGVSIDGPQVYHDKYRVTHQGKGTYEKTRNGIELMKQAFYEKKLNFGIGALCVINPEFSGRVIYRHFVDELNLNSFDFLLPDNTWDTIASQDFHAEEYGRFLIEVFDEWVKDNNPNIFVRILSSVISGLKGKRLHFHDFSGWLDKFLLITISSNGIVSPDDTYRSADPMLMQTELNIRNSSFSDLLSNASIEKLKTGANTLAVHCMDCEWKNFCKSGSLLHRYSKKNQFLNHSLYCDGLKLLFSKVNSALVSEH